MKFHERLNKIMKEKGINQAQLCKLSGIATSAMSHYVRGDTDPSFTKVLAIAKALDVPVDELASDEFSSSGYTVPVLTLNWDERTLIKFFRKMDGDYQTMLLKTAAAYADMSLKNSEGMRKTAEGAVTS